MLEKQQPVDLVQSRAGDRGRKGKGWAMDRLHERVLRLDNEDRRVDGLEFLGAVLYPRDEGERRAWVSCALIGLISSMRDRIRLEGISSWENLFEDLWDISRSPRDRCFDGLTRWAHCIRVAETVLLTLWSRRTQFKYRNLEHWRQWIAKRDRVGHSHFRNLFGDFKDSSHLTAALLSTPDDNPLRAGLLASDDPELRAVGTNYLSALSLESCPELSVIDRLNYVVVPLSNKTYRENLLRRAELLRILCAEHKILNPKQAWVVADVTPFEELELEPPPQEAIDWLEAEFPG